MHKIKLGGSTFNSIDNGGKYYAYSTWSTGVVDFINHRDLAIWSWKD